MSKKNPSSIVSGASLVSGLFTDLVQAVREAGGTDEDIYRLVTPEGKPTLVQVAALIVRKIAVEAVDSFTVTVDYGLSLAKMIAAGDYGYINSDITAKHFPVTGRGKVARKLVLVHLGREATKDEVLAEMARRGLKPAGLEDLLAFGAAYPDEQRKFSIIGLGCSGWVGASGDRNFPCLDESNGRRLNLDWGWDGERWDAHCRFLSFCE